ncbi:MAG: hypothetical protein ACXVBU_07795 [Ktedonobacteraceae bacterium]
MFSLAQTFLDASRTDVNLMPLFSVGPTPESGLSANFPVKGDDEIFKLLGGSILVMAISAISPLQGLRVFL